MKTLLLVVLVIGIGASTAQAAGKRCQEEDDGVRSHDTKRPTQVTFINTTKAPVRVYWLNYQGRRELQKELSPGQRLAKKTNILNVWAVTDTDDNCREVVLSGMQSRTVRIQ